MTPLSGIRPCACTSEPVYTGMSPIGSGWVQVGYKCDDCGSIWPAKMTQAEANDVRNKFIEREKQKSPTNGAGS